MKLIERCHILSNTLWLHLKVTIDGKNITLCISKDGIKKSGEYYQLYDFVEEKEFIYNTNDNVNSVEFRYIQTDKNGSMIGGIEGVEKNNTFFKDIFEKQKIFVSKCLKTEDNLRLIKSLFFFKKIELMNNLRIQDFYSAYQSDSFFLEKARENCKILLNEHKTHAIDKLLIEKKSFLENNDLESTEEIDIILQIIEESVSQVNFEDAKEISDLYELWPPILLPTPF